MPATSMSRYSLRLQGYDYANQGAYFVTLVTSQRETLLGTVDQDVFHMSQMGKIVQDTWTWLGRQYPYVELDESCLMPNHLHGILWIVDDRPELAVKFLGRLVGAFKTVSTKWVNRYRNTPGAPLWQRDFYDHIIHNDEDLNRIRVYIQTNPIRWTLDRFNPNLISPDPPKR